MSASHIEKAIAELGGPSAVARLRGLRSPWSVSKWIRDGLPAEHVLWLAQQTQWTYTPHMLAPTLYPNVRDALPPDLQKSKAERAA